MSSLMNNWRKLKPELVPEAEQALVLICQGLFKKAALVGFSVMLANKCEVSPGMLKNVSTFSYKHTVKTHRQVTGDCVSPGFIKIHCTLCFYAIWVWLQSNSLHTNWVNQSLPASEFMLNVISIVLRHSLLDRNKYMQEYFCSNPLIEAKG